MKPRLLLFILLTLLLPALCLAASRKKPAAKDDRSLKAVTKVQGDSRNRVALVIGNSSYVSSPLRNPANDARAMAAVLRRLGFEVVERTNLGYAAMNDAIESFGEKLQPGGVALFYYAGHGMQVGGNNYLIPVDARISKENEIRYKSVDAGLILAKMEGAKSDVNIAIMDACRDNPFSRSFRSGAKGLAQVDAPSGTIIAFATAPGKTAADGSGNNGVYTEALVQALETPGMKVEEVFKQVRRVVVGKTDKAQTPWESSSLMGDFHFIPPSGAEPPPQQVAPRPQVPPPKLSSSLDDIIASSEAAEQAKKAKAEQVKADLAKYEKILSSPRGEELKQTAWNALVSRYPEAEKLKVGDIDGLMSIMKIEGYEAEEGQNNGVPARPSLPFTLNENVWLAIENSEAYRKAPKPRALKVVSNAKLHTEYTGSKSRTIAPSPPSDYNTQREIIPVSGKCYADKTDVTISNQNSTSTNYYCGTYLLSMGSSLPTENYTQLTSIDEITGSLFPMRIGAKQSIKYSVAYLKDRKYDWTISTNCSVISRTDANKLHTKLTGVAWKIQCHSTTVQAGKNTPSTTYDYYLSDLRVFVGMMGARDNVTSTSVLPVPGSSYQLYEAQGEYGSRATMVYSLFDWATGEQSGYLMSPAASAASANPFGKILKMLGEK